jgi:hypothetical protein
LRWETATDQVRNDVPLIEIETSFGTVAAPEEALVDAVLALLRTGDPHRATPEDLLEAVSW